MVTKGLTHHLVFCSLPMCAGINLLNSQQVAIKFEPRKSDAPQLRDEYRTYKILAGSSKLAPWMSFGGRVHFFIRGFGTSLSLGGWVQVQCIGEERRYRVFLFFFLFGWVGRTIVVSQAAPADGPFRRVSLCLFFPSSSPYFLFFFL